MTSSLGAHRDWRRYHYRAKYTDYTTVELFHSSELGNEPGFYGRASRHIQNGGQKMPSKLHIGNLAYSVSNNDLEELFSKIGQVQSVSIIMDHFTGQSKGFGFVEMTNAEDAAKVIEQFNDTELKGRSIKVNEANPRESSFGGSNLSGAYRSGGHSHGGDRR